MTSRSRSHWPVVRCACAVALFAAAGFLGGCSAGSTVADHVPTALGGLPEGTPQRPNTTSAYPPVHDKPRTDRYSSSRGIPGLRRAQAAYYARRFGVKLNPETEVVTTFGSKEGFASVAQAITAPGEVVVVPIPSYPIHAFGFLMAGGAIRAVQSEPTPEFFALLERAITRSIP